MIDVCLRRLAACVLSAGLLWTSAAAHAEERAADAVNRSAHLQMLVERITRSYAMLGQGVNPPRARRQIETDVAAADADLAALRGMPLNAAQKQSVARINELWPGFKTATRRAPSLESADALVSGSAALSLATATCTNGLSSKVVDRFDAVGLAGSARTLSQRMAKLYFYSTWGVKAPEGTANFKAMGQEFESSLDKLGIAPQNDASTQADLAIAHSQWVFFSSALAKLGTSNGEEAKMQQMGDVAKASDAMLEVLDTLAQKYAASTEQDWAN